MNNGMTLIIAVLCVLIIAYRFYSAFIAAKVLALDPRRQTPAYRLKDGHNYDPTNKWVLFGHHFAAIAGAGPLVGPVIAAQFGYLPGLLWILIGVVLAGAVQDFIILVLSIRRDGKSLAQIAFMEINPVAGTAATLGIIFVLIIALAGLGKVVVSALGGDRVTYPAGTAFVGSPTSGVPIKENYDKTTVYNIYAGVQIQYPDQPDGTKGAVVLVNKPFHLITYPTKSDGGFDIDVAVNPPESPTPRIAAIVANAHGSKSTKPQMGYALVVPPDFDAHREIDGSAWGTFTIAMTIPIALFVGFYMYRLRKGKILEASIIGAALTLVAVYLGGMLDNPLSFMSTFRDTFNLQQSDVGMAMAVYGFLASILPVWLLLCPRDYLSAFLKIGTVVVMVLAVICAHPTLHAPAINHTFINGGPAVPGSVFPFVFITIMCGAISGFHALVSSGTTPKMIENETHARPIGYGAMLIEGLVGIVALIAACSLPTSQYYYMQTSAAQLPKYQQDILSVVQHDEATNPMPALNTAKPAMERNPNAPPPPKPATAATSAHTEPAENLPPDDPETRRGKSIAALEDRVQENLQGRNSGAVALAVGMAQIFDDAARNILGNADAAIAWLEGMMKYWYHFAIMFEALFILTTIDAGTRVGRFLLQETFGKWIHPSLGKPSNWPSAILATAIIVGGWYYFLSAQSFPAMWSMFGVANQLLAVMALTIATVALIRTGKKKYIAVTLLPLFFVATTTTSAAVLLLKGYFANMSSPDSVKSTNAIISAVALLAILACTAAVVLSAFFCDKSQHPEPVESDIAPPPETTEARS